MEEKVPSFLERIKSDNKSTRNIFLILLGICLFIFLCNYRHIYNTLTGPHAVETVELMKPGIKRVVVVEGPLRRFGTRQTTKEWKGLEVGSAREAGLYYLSATSNASFLVFSEKQIEPPVTGRLKRFSKEEAKGLPESDRLSRWYVDAGRGKWYDTNLFMWIAVPAFFIFLPFFFMSLFKKPMEHPVIKQLAEWGDPETLMREIDADMNRHPEQVSERSFFSKDWGILFWVMTIFRAEDIRSISMVVDEGNKQTQRIVFHLVDGEEHRWDIKQNEEGAKILDTLLKIYRTKCTAAMRRLVERRRAERQ